MRTTLQLSTALVVGLFVTSTVVAQPTITSNTFLSLIGSSMTITEENADPGSSIAVNVGSAGANQTWDFSGITLNGDMYTRTFSNPAGTPYAAQFPGSNFLFESVFVDSTGEFRAYQYANVTAGAYTELGDVFETGDTTIVEVSTDPLVINLPISMNTMWTDVSRDTIAFAGSGIVSIDSTVNTVDAWGTVTLANGTYDVLRIRGDEIFISQTYVSGSLFASDTSRTIDYEWISPTHFIVASMTSVEGDENPNFTQAGFVSFLFAIGTGVEDSPEPAEDVIFRSLYPNPAVESVTIEFETAARNVDLAVFDLLGRRVRTLPASAGSGVQSVWWDGTTASGQDAASGIYLVRIQADNRIETRRVVLTR